jgi:hypothetical protein
VLSSLEKAYRLEVNPTNLSGTEKKTCRPPLQQMDNQRIRAA